MNVYIILLCNIVCSKERARRPFLRIIAQYCKVFALSALWYPKGNSIFYPRLHLNSSICCTRLITVTTWLFTNLVCRSTVLALNHGHLPVDSICFAKQRGAVSLRCCYRQVREMRSNSLCLACWLVCEQPNAWGIIYHGYANTAFQKRLCAAAGDFDLFHTSCWIVLPIFDVFHNFPIIVYRWSDCFALFALWKHVSSAFLHLWCPLFKHIYRHQMVKCSKAHLLYT